MELQDLPDVDLLLVLDFFSNQEKIKILMFVCKRWHLLLQTDIWHLAIYERRPPYQLFWNNFSRKAIDQKLIVKTKELNEKFPIKFSNLKKLFLYKLARPRLFLSCLSENGCLDQLLELRMEHLDGRRHFFDLVLKSKLNLPSLRTLHAVYEPFSETLNAPNLESLVIPLNHLTDNFWIPDTIKFLQCKVFARKQILANLEHLICQSIDPVLSLEQVPRLKRLELFPTNISEFETIEALKAQKEKLKRTDLLIWVSGFKTNFTIDLANSFRQKSWWAVGLLCYDLPFRLLDHIDYNEPLSVFPWSTDLCSRFLVQQFPNLEGIPENFFNVFIDIRELSIAVPVNGENLIRFIQKLKNLEYLSVSGYKRLNENVYENQFNENFFHELSQIQSIKFLFLTDVFLSSQSDYDIGFVLNLKNLWLISIRTNISVKISAKRLIEFLRANWLTGLETDLQICSYRAKHFEVFIDGEGCGLCWADGKDHINDDDKLEFSSLDELLAYIENMALSNECTIFI